MSGEGATPPFVPGLALSRRFFREAVEPIVHDVLPDLRYAAALIGDGSDVLGYDDGISANHDWGSRVLLFVPEDLFARHARMLIEILERRLPERFEGWPTAFSDQDRIVGFDVDALAAGSPGHGVEVHVLDAWASRQLGIRQPGREPTPSEWLTIPEQALLGVTAGDVFRDDLGALADLRARFAFFPEDVRLAKLAALWDAVADEMPFVGRAGHVGDDAGSRILCARLAELAMRICLLAGRRYAPYSKWLGTAWARLPAAAAVAPHLDAALAASCWNERDAATAAMFETVARAQVEAGVPGAVEPVLKGYFTRPYTVVNAGEIATGLRSAIADPALTRA
jgi:hypothetical protein